VADFESTLSIAGSIASIGAALWSFFEAKKAVRAASQAEKVRDQMIERRKIVEVSQVLAVTTRVLRTVSAVGPSSNQSLLRGINCASIAREVEEYSRFLNEQSSHFSDFFENKAKELCSDIREDIEALAEAKAFEDKKAAGKRIYYKINDFLPKVKALADEKKEHVEID
jgi:hypothetical protein